MSIQPQEFPLPSDVTAQVTLPPSPVVAPVEVSATLRDQIRARIKGAPAYSSEHVHVAEWGVELEVRSMSLGQRNDMLKVARDADGQVDSPKLTVLATIASVYDAEGVPVFGPADTDWLASLDAQVIDKVVLVALKLNGFAGTSKVEDAAKKSDSTETSA